MIEEVFYREDLWETAMTDWNIFLMLSDNNMWDFFIDMCNKYPSNKDEE